MFIIQHTVIGISIYQDWFSIGSELSILATDFQIQYRRGYIAVYIIYRIIMDFHCPIRTPVYQHHTTFYLWPISTFAEAPLGVHRVGWRGEGIFTLWVAAVFSVVFLPSFFQFLYYFLEAMRWCTGTGTHSFCIDIQLWDIPPLIFDDCVICINKVHTSFSLFIFVAFFAHCEHSWDRLASFPSPFQIYRLLSSREGSLLYWRNYSYKIQFIFDRLCEWLHMHLLSIYNHH